MPEILKNFQRSSKRSRITGGGGVLEIQKREIQSEAGYKPSRYKIAIWCDNAIGVKLYY